VLVDCYCDPVDGQPSSGHWTDDPVVIGYCWPYCVDGDPVDWPSPVKWLWWLLVVITDYRTQYWLLAQARMIIVNCCYYWLLVIIVDWYWTSMVIVLLIGCWIVIVNESWLVIDYLVIVGLVGYWPSPVGDTIALLDCWCRLTLCWTDIVYCYWLNWTVLTDWYWYYWLTQLLLVGQ